MGACIRRCLKKHYPNLGYFATGLAIAGILVFLLTPGVREGGLLTAAVAAGIAQIIGVSVTSTVLYAFLKCLEKCW